MINRDWATEVTRRVGSPATTRILTEMEIRNATLNKRLTDYLELKPDIFEDGIIKVSTTGLQFGTELEIHAWVPTRKTLKSTYQNRTEIDEATFNRIPKDVHSFLMSGKDESILSGRTKFTPKKWNVETGEVTPAARSVTVYTTALIDYAATEVTRIDGRECIVMEIHEYRPVRSAVKIIIYLND